MEKEEKEYYPMIKEKLEGLLKTKTTNVHLEITANNKFSEELKSEIKSERNIIFNFLDKVRPDITGFIKDSSYFADFIIVEFKKGKIDLKSIYQAKRYRELFNAKFTFLISSEPVPTEIKRLDKAMNDQLLRSGLHWESSFVIVQFDRQEGQFIEWYPENPFEKDTYWK